MPAIDRRLRGFVAGATFTTTTTIDRTTSGIDVTTLSPDLSLMTSGDSRNKSWAQSEGLGKRLLKSMGWTEGQGLGKDGTGRVDNVRVAKALGEQGLGFGGGDDDKDPTAAIKGLGRVLAELKEVKGDDERPEAVSESDIGEPPSSTRKEKKKRRKEDKEKATAETSSSSSEPDDVVQARKKKSKRDENEEEDDEQEKGPLVRPRYRKFKAAKDLSNRSEEDLRAIFG